jgi:hypothetical protein
MLKKALKIFSKKGRSLRFLPFFIFLAACAMINPSRYGKVTLHNTGDLNSFTFIVSDEFLIKNNNSPQDQQNTKLSEAEAELLYNLLKQKKYCLAANGRPAFIVTSRQEKVFDMTFAHLIEKNYKSRPIVPRTYFGHCKAK